MQALVVRLTAAAALLAAATVVVAALVVHAVAERSTLRARTEADLAAIVGVAEVTVEEEALRRALARTAAGREGRLAVHSGGRTVGISRMPPGPLPRGSAEVSAGGGTVLLRPAGDGRGTVEAFVPPWRPGASTAAVLGVLVAAAAIGVAGAAAVAGRRVRPVAAELSAAVGTARELAAGAPASEAARGITPETAALAAALDAVAGHIEDVRAAERRLQADLSHRLRTPLTALALDADSIGEGPVADRVRRAVASLDHDVDALIRAVRPESPEPARCDVVDVVGRRMTFWSALGRHRGRECEVHTVEPPATIALAAEDLAAVLDALLGNVFRYTPEGSAFAVRVVRHAGWVTLVVDDAGPGVADPVAALRRGVSGCGSTGLGLDIARDAVEATGGTIHIERSALGGARIRLRFAEAGSARADPGQPRAWRLWRGDGAAAGAV